MINKKNIWFLTLFSLILVLSVYYVTMPSELLLTNNSELLNDNISNPEIEELSIIETLNIEDDANTLDEINKLKETIAKEGSSAELKNEAFDAIRLLNQISTQEEILEEKIKANHNLASFVKVDGDQIRVVIDSKDHSNTLANNIMKTIQNNFDTKQYISIQFK